VIENLLTQEAFQSLVDGEVDRLSFFRSVDGSIAERRPPSKIALFPGSFNPLHAGHREMARLAAKQTGREIWFEISIGNVEKPSLDYREAVSRLKQFEGQNFRQRESSASELHLGVVLTSSPSFAEKLKLFPDSIFIVGADTIARINELRFYQSLEHRTEVFRSFENGKEKLEGGCRFLVFGRWRGEVFELDQEALDPTLRAQCDFVAQNKFEAKVSSTEIRQQEDR